MSSRIARLRRGYLLRRGGSLSVALNGEYSKANLPLVSPSNTLDECAGEARLFQGLDWEIGRIPSV